MSNSHAQQISLPPLTVREMFVYSRKPNDIFGIVGYDVPKKYCDPLKNMKEREYLTQKKGVRPRNKAKLPIKPNENKSKGTPAPNAYNIIKPWVEVTKEKRSKSMLSKTRNVSKYTYIDRIFMEAKRVKTPGPGSYNPFGDEVKKIEKVTHKSKNKDEKPSFLQECEFIGAMLPGPGSYNPHKEVKKLHTNRTKPKDWISKHSAKNKEKLKSPYPDQGTYNPLPINMNTFARIYKENDGKTKNSRARSNYFGKVERFGEIKTKKSKSFSIPGPGFYNVLYEWQGKKEKKDKNGEKKTNLSSIISKGLDKSIYYD